MDKDTLITINNLIEEYFHSYTALLDYTDEEEYCVTYENLKYFRLKIATTVLKKADWPSNKKFSINVNLNGWVGFKDYWDWSLKNCHFLNIEYIMLIYRDLINQVNDQLPNHHPH